MRRSQKLTFGVDPGTQVTGVCLFRGHKLVDASTIRSTKSKSSFIIRTLNIAESFSEYMRELRGRISPRDIDVAIETPGNQSRPGRARSLIPIGCSMGMMVHTAYSEGYKIHLVPATEWTRMGTSRGIAKEERMQTIRRVFPDYLLEADKGLDACDAIGVASHWLGILPDMVMEDE